MCMPPDNIVMVCENVLLVLVAMLRYLLPDSKSSKSVYAGWVLFLKNIICFLICPKRITKKIQNFQ